VKAGEKPIANPLVVLREEFDDWAVLFDPDTGNAFGLNPIGVYLWKRLDGTQTVDDVLMALHRDVHDVPQEVSAHLTAFIEELIERGLLGYPVEQDRHDRGRAPPRPICTGTMPFAYETPHLVNLNGEPAMGACCTSGTGASGLSSCCGGACLSAHDCQDGACPGGVWCDTGTQPGSICDAGVSASRYFCTNGGSAGEKCMTGTTAGTCLSGTST
jgi:SynChlorMet cassette protein ScmD